MGSRQAMKMSIWGIGPWVMTPVVLYDVAAGAATWAWPQWFSIPWVPYPALLAAGSALFLLGLVLQAAVGRALAKAYCQDRLVTTGPYAICRNPLYANVIFTIAPGIALMCRSWPMLAASLLLYVLVRLHIRREETYLEKRFGQDYIDYRHRTNAIFPTTLWCGKERN